MACMDMQVVMQAEMRGGSVAGLRHPRATRRATRTNVEGAAWCVRGHAPRGAFRQSGRQGEVSEPTGPTELDRCAEHFELAGKGAELVVGVQGRDGDAKSGRTGRHGGRADRLHVVAAGKEGA